MESDMIWWDLYGICSDLTSLVHIWSDCIWYPDSTNDYEFSDEYEFEYDDYEFSDEYGYEFEENMATLWNSINFTVDCKIDKLEVRKGKKCNSIKISFR